jgi:16S rRNA (cytidine1402-2'-O)-methyltransferase
MTCTLVFYESPHRIEEMLADLHEVLGDREVCVSREITKLYEEYVFGRLSTIGGRVRPQGEFVVVVEGGKEIRETAPKTREEVLKKLGMTRNELYDLFFRKPGG